MDSLKISVVTVCYNAVNAIEETMLSVLNQTYDNVEYIIIDGGSTDGTVDIIKKYADRLAYWVSESDKGIYDAMNKGIEAASGDYIIFMNAGDCFYNSHVLRSVCLQGDIIYGDAVFKYPNFKLLFKPQSLDRFKDYFPIYHQATFVKVTIAKQYPFDCKYRSSADYDLLRRLYYNNFKFTYTPTIICIFEAVEGLSSTNIKLRLLETNTINGTISEWNNKLKIWRVILKYQLQHRLTEIMPYLMNKLRKRSLLKNKFVYLIDEE